MNLKDKVAIVTGGAMGIGRAMAEGLAEEGAGVVIADISKADIAAREMKAKGFKAIGVRVDVSSETETVKMAEEAVKAFDRIDILINNAGIYTSLIPGPMEKITVQEWRKVMDVNVMGMWLCAKAVVEEMRKAGGGRVININSGVPFKGIPFLLHYVASKGAVIGLTRALAKELGKDLQGIDCGFITHWHFDHTGAMPALLKSMVQQPPFYVPVREPSFSLINGFVESRLPSGFNRVEVDEPQEILPDIHSTGCFEGTFPLQRHPVHEQALYMNVEGKGLVLLVGCSHPKPQDIARRAMELSGEERIALMLGGFHFIPPTKEPQREETIRELKGMDIDSVAACHCTGAEGMDRMEREFGDRFLRVELGGVYGVGEETNKPSPQ